MAENAGKTLKTDYDATRYLPLELADGTPVRMRWDVFLQAISPVLGNLLYGASDASSLASVVAEQFTSYGLTAGDANTYFNTGIYNLHYGRGTISNIPSNIDASNAIVSIHVVKSISENNMYNVEQTLHDTRTNDVYYRYGHIYTSEASATFNNDWKQLT